LEQKGTYEEWTAAETSLGTGCGSPDPVDDTRSMGSRIRYLRLYQCPRMKEKREKRFR
jgi:hypothetical protein